MAASNTNQEPIKVEKTFDARSNEVWEAITDKE